MLTSKIMVIQLLLLVFIGCGASGPNTSEAETAIKKSLEIKVPVKLSGDLMGGKNAIVKEVKVLEIGSSEKKGNSEFWSVKVNVSGRCSVGFFGGKIKTFKGEVIYKLSQDGFGEWKASHDGVF